MQINCLRKSKLNIDKLITLNISLVLAQRLAKRLVYRVSQKIRSPASKFDYLKMT